MRCEVKKNVQEIGLQIWPFQYDIFDRGHAKINSILRTCSNRINESRAMQDTRYRQHINHPTQYQLFYRHSGMRGPDRPSRHHHMCHCFFV